jgi:dual specificity protein kinase YAK1
MDPQWNSQMEPNRQRYAPQTVPSHEYTPRDLNSAAAVKPEAYSQPSSANRTPQLPMTSPGMPQGRGPEYNGDGDGDVRMEDVDQYNKPKQSSRGHSRMPSAQLAQEESAAARRYSPMILSPSSPYAATPQSSAQGAYSSYTPQTQNRASPTRSNSFMSPPQNYYASPPCEFPIRSQASAPAY